MARDLSGVLEAILSGVVVVDAEGRIELLNTAACRILGSSAEWLMSEPVESPLGAEHAIARLARSVLASGGSSVENACAVERRGDSDLTIDVAASPLFDGAGRVAGAVLVLRDSTIRQSLQEIVSERQSLSAFGLIAAGIAHEVKNPLGGIRGAAEILASRAADAKTLEAAEMIVREVDRIANLLDDLMVFSSAEALHLTPVNIHRVLDEVIELVAMDAAGRDVSVQRHYDPSLPEVLADRDRLTQVFLNLLRNAAQAMEGRSGCISISTRTGLDHRLSDEAGRQLPALIVEILDAGPGIAPEVVDKLATPLFTTRPGGAGLGLAVSRHWVARHGGTLQLESHPEGGARARVIVPLRRAP